MKRNPFLAGILSFLIPGLGQIYLGKNNRGAALLAAAIIIGNMNIIVLLLIALANPEGSSETRMLWQYWMSRVVHDILSLWSIAFWVWAVADAIGIARNESKKKEGA